MGDPGKAHKGLELQLHLLRSLGQQRSLRDPINRDSKIKHPVACRGVLTALFKYAGFQPAFAPRSGELNPKRFKEYTHSFRIYETTLLRFLRPLTNDRDRLSSNFHHICSANSNSKCDCTIGGFSRQAALTLKVLTRSCNNGATRGYFYCPACLLL